MEFVSWIAENPLAAEDVIPGADGARKVRWAIAGKGKPGGVRVVYFHLSADGMLTLVIVYAKSDRANTAPTDIRKA
jgi:hypothetical protein